MQEQLYYSRVKEQNPIKRGKNISNDSQQNEGYYKKKKKGNLKFSQN